MIGSYIDALPRWHVEPNNVEPNNVEPIETTVLLKQLVGSGLTQQQQQQQQQVGQPMTVQGFVNPTSNQALWWPSDLTTIQIRPTLDVFIKSASPAYILAGLEARVPPSCSKDGKEWRNFGMNSQLLATQWTTFGFAVENGFRVESFLGKGDIVAVDVDVDVDVAKQQEQGIKHEKSIADIEETKEEEEFEWEPIYSIDDEDKSCYTQKNEAVKQTKEAVEKLGNLLAELDEDSPLANGMHIVSIPISSKWRNIPLPESNQKLRLVSVGTAEPDAMELLSFDEDLIAMSATSLLDIDVEMIAPGSQSEYIPVSAFFAFSYHSSFK
jgi:hypothetical protein